MPALRTHCMKDTYCSRHFADVEERDALNIRTYAEIPSGARFDSAPLAAAVYNPTYGANGGGEGEPNAVRASVHIRKSEVVFTESFVVAKTVHPDGARDVQQIHINDCGIEIVTEYPESTMQIQLPRHCGGGKVDVYLVYIQNDNPNPPESHAGPPTKTLTYLTNSSLIGGYGPRRSQGGSGNIRHKVVSRTTDDQGIVQIAVAWFATRNIQKGAELTWPYMHSRQRDGFGTTLVVGTDADVEAHAKEQDKEARTFLQSRKETLTPALKLRRFNVHTAIKQAQRTAMEERFPVFCSPAAFEKRWAWKLHWDTRGGTDTSAAAMHMLKFESPPFFQGRLAPKPEVDELAIFGLLKKLTKPRPRLQLTTLGESECESHYCCKGTSCRGVSAGGCCWCCNCLPPLLE